jgi:predicted outer membrane repeat protein
LIIIILILTTMSSATIINVPGDYSTIQGGLNAAVQGDTVLVQPGTYVENIAWPSVNGIKLLSAGDSSNTIIDGSNTCTVIYFPENSNIDTATVICGFRITNGGDVQDGGGIYLDYSSPTIEDCSINGNSAIVSGGGIYCIVSSPTILDCTISGNSAIYGGGIYCTHYSDPTLKEVLFENNYASSYGGGIRCQFDSNPSIEHCTITSNQAGIEGDGIHISSRASPSISYCNIYLNGMGSYNSNYHIVNCPNNWWGDASGPYHPTLNPNGLGDSTNVYVNPMPFLTEPDSLAPPAGISEHHFNPPAIFRLYPNYPNPFNATTTIAFELPVISKVTLKVYNILGQVVATIIEDKMLSSGRHEVTFSDKNLSSGVYFYQLTAGRNTAIGKMVLLK